MWLSFGCDEEVFGAAATEAVDELERRGVRPWFVIDEGGGVAHDAFPGVEQPVGVVGVTEKGVTSLELRRRGPRRARLHPGQDGAHGPARASHHPARPLAHARQPPGADGGAASAGWRRTRRCRCGR